MIISPMLRSVPSSFWSFWLFLPVVCTSVSFAVDDLAKESQNPVGDLASLPIELHHYVRG